MAFKTCIIAVLLLTTACTTDSLKQGKTPPFQTPLLSLQQDSGFITKKIGLPFLIAHNLTDTTGPFWDDLRDSDTIAKYYKVRKTGHFYYCTIDLNPEYMFGTHLMLELSQNGKVLQSERFFHGNYTCCWENLYEGFRKYDDYFCIKTCSTGSGFCASHLYLFKNLASQDTMESVLLNYWEAMGGEDRNPRSLTSSLAIKNDTLLVHYQLEEGKIVNDKFKVRKTRRFDVPYVSMGHNWIAQDSTMFRLNILW